MLVSSTDQPTGEGPNVGVTRCCPKKPSPFLNEIMYIRTHPYVVYMLLTRQVWFTVNSSGCCVYEIGTVMHKVCPSQEPSATLAMYVIVEHTLEHPMMVLQGDHVPRGHFVLQVPLNLILVVLEHTVRALVEQVTRIVSCVIPATFVLGSSLQLLKEHVMLGITVQRDPSYAIRQLPQLGISLQ